MSRDCGFNLTLKSCMDGFGGEFDEYCQINEKGNCAKIPNKTTNVIYSEILERDSDAINKQKLRMSNKSHGKTIPSINIEQPKIIAKDPSKMEPSLDISKKIDDILATLEVRDLHEVHDLSDEELDILLTSIKIESKSKDTLMDLVYKNAEKNGVRPKTMEFYNIKVRVLLDNLAKKICRCIPDIQYNGEGRKTGVCRSTIFQKRGIDFNTFQCIPEPVLLPKKGSKNILHKYKKA